MADSACIFYRLPPPSHLPLSGLPVIDSFHGKSLHNRRKEDNGIDASQQDVVIEFRKHRPRAHCESDGQASLKASPGEQDDKALPGKAIRDRAEQKGSRKNAAGTA